MTGLARGSIVLLLSVLAVAAQAQVHRCGDGRTYTDKPCHGATDVDLRVNLLEAGPRYFPRHQPAPVVVLPDTSRQAPAAPSSGNVWTRKSDRDAAHWGRTGPYRP